MILAISNWGCNMPADNGFFGLYSKIYKNLREVEMSVDGYLGKCADDPEMMAGAAERLLQAIGEPKMVDTSLDQRLCRIFMNRTIKGYPAFSDFFGLEETIEGVVGLFPHSAPGAQG